MTPPKFGISFSFQAHRTLGEPYDKAYRGAIELAAEANRLGFHSIWASEHHGEADGYCPSPVVACAALAVAAPNCRIGQAVALAPLHGHPMRLAEDLSVVVSGDVATLERGLDANRPEIDAAARAVRRGEALLDGTRRAAQFPQLMIGVDYWYMPTFPDFHHAYGAMVAINLPWLSGRRRGLLRGRRFGRFREERAGWANVARAGVQNRRPRRRESASSSSHQKCSRGVSISLCPPTRARHASPLRARLSHGRINPATGVVERAVDRARRGARGLGCGATGAEDEEQGKEREEPAETTIGHCCPP